MSSAAGSWLNLAKQDALAARKLLQPPPSLPHAAYFVQQAAEKAIKAQLIHLGIDFPRHGGRGHDLVALAGLVPPADPMKMMCEALAAVTPWATAFRYPSDDPATELRLTVQDVEGRLDQVDVLIRILGTLHQDGSQT
ncbi:MAG: HEPN domain-containing protein [Rhodopseudomonas palustris]|uniref:HEPN domain-containing protein n=1 Tax=Rhodopseudomonas palustris TaxID=1076 RepID=A0A933S1R3_RHOPL|nr:HEPN domain-containing protein [Rhodopseudomonas palustris]